MKGRSGYNRLGKSRVGQGKVEVPWVGYGMIR